MKKINLMLGAAVIACTAFFASCNNGTKTFVDVTEEKYSNTYDLVSYSKKEVVSVSEKDSTGAAVNHDDETTETVWVPLTEPTNTGKSVATISWTKSEVEDGFISYELKVNNGQSMNGKKKVKNPGDADFGTEQTASQNISTIYFYKEGDKYYTKGNSGNYYELSGDPENATTLSFTDVSVEGDSNSSGSWQLATAKDKKVTTTTTTYTIVLKASESL